MNGIFLKREAVPNLFESPCALTIGAKLSYFLLF